MQTPDASRSTRCAPPPLGSTGSGGAWTVHAAARGLACLILVGCAPGTPPLPKAAQFASVNSHDTGTTEAPGLPADSGDTGDDGPPLPDPTETLDVWSFVSLDSNIWSALSVYDDTVWLATLYGKTTAFYDISNGIDAFGPRIDTMMGEPVEGFVLTDISTALMSDRVIVAASDPDQTGIVLGAYDLSGVALVEPIQVVTDSIVPTNDMKLVRSGETLHLHYGADGYEKMVGIYDAELSIIEPPRPVDDPSNGSQLGCVVPTEDGFVRIAGNFKNHGLVGVHYDLDWNTTDDDAFVLPIPAEDDEWLWFSSGCVQDPQTGHWYVAHQHMWNGENADTQSSVQLSRFDPDWNHVATLQVTGRSGYTRPQLGLRGDDLFLSFDRGNGDVQVGWAPLDPRR